jgi:hypothetical protein
MTQQTDGISPRVIGWTVDMEPCRRHGGVGVGLNVYILMPDGSIVPLWWCSVDRIDDFFVDNEPAV